MVVGGPGSFYWQGECYTDTVCGWMCVCVCACARMFCYSLEAGMVTQTERETGHVEVVLLHFHIIPLLKHFSSEVCGITSWITVWIPLRKSCQLAASGRQSSCPASGFPPGNAGYSLLRTARISLIQRRQCQNIFEDMQTVRRSDGLETKLSLFIATH